MVVTRKRRFSMAGMLLSTTSFASSEPLTVHSRCWSLHEANQEFNRDAHHETNHFQFVANVSSCREFDEASDLYGLTEEKCFRIEKICSSFLHSISHSRQLSEEDALSGTAYNAKSEAQRLALGWVSRITASLSILAACIVLHDILSHEHRRKRVFCQLVLGLAVCDIVGSLPWVFASVAVPDEARLQNGKAAYGAIGNEATCTAQGFFVELGLGSFMYNVSLCLYYWLVIVKQCKESRLRVIVKWLHIGPITIAVTLAFAGIPFYTWHPFICYIQYNPLQEHAVDVFVFIFLPVVTAMVALTFLSLRIYWTVRVRSRRVQRYLYGDKTTLEQRVFWQSCAFIAASSLTWPVVLLSAILGGANGGMPYWFSMILLLAAPLQGLLNAIVYFRHRIRAHLDDQCVSKSLRFWRPISDNGPVVGSIHASNLTPSEVANANNGESLGAGQNTTNDIEDPENLVSGGVKLVSFVEGEKQLMHDSSLIDNSLNISAGSKITVRDGTAVIAMSASSVRRSSLMSNDRSRHSSMARSSVGGDSVVVPLAELNRYASNDTVIIPHSVLGTNDNGEFTPMSRLVRHITAEADPSIAIAYDEQEFEEVNIGQLPDLCSASTFFDVERRIKTARGLPIFGERRESTPNTRRGSMSTRPTRTARSSMLNVEPARHGPSPPQTSSMRRGVSLDTGAIINNVKKAAQGLPLFRGRRKDPPTATTEVDGSQPSPAFLSNSSRSVPNAPMESGKVGTQQLPENPGVLPEEPQLRNHSFGNQRNDNLLGNKPNVKWDPLEDSSSDNSKGKTPRTLPKLPKKTLSIQWETSEMDSSHSNLYEYQSSKGLSKAGISQRDGKP